MDSYWVYYTSNMNKFINREAELQSLHDDYARPGSSLYILYGRRRLGKTTLLRQFAARRPAVYHMADRSAESHARRLLTGAQVEENAQASRMGALTPEELAEIQSIYSAQNFFTRR